MASLDTTSENVVISLTQPVGGATVTGYRIYYSAGGMQTSEAFTTPESQLVLNLRGDTLDDMMISIRAESAQLPSELVNVIVMSTPSTTTDQSTTTTPPMMEATIVASTTTAEGEQVV